MLCGIRLSRFMILLYIVGYQGDKVEGWWGGGGEGGMAEIFIIWNGLVNQS